MRGLGPLLMVCLLPWPLAGCGGATTRPVAGSADADDSPLGPHTPSAVPEYLIVAADTLTESAQRYAEFRRTSGYHVDLARMGDIVGDAVDATATARLREHVRARYQARDPARPLYLLLLGDAETTWPGERSSLPTGSWRDAATTASVASDNVFADIDGDDIPDLAVGRITADNDDEVDRVRGKVAAVEADREIGEWDRRLNVFASTSGMGDLVDAAIENVVYDITEAIPYDYDVTMTYARQSSPYVYIPEQFSDQVYRRINEGSLLVAYVGHGSRDSFASLVWNGSPYPILDTGKLDRLAVTHRSPILVFVACSTGAFAGNESLSERILARPDAPTAIFSSTEDSHPYANALFIYEISQAFTVTRAATVGDAFLLAKQRLLAGTGAVRSRIDAAAGLLVSASEKAALQRSHLHMYTLFGDPAMAVPYMGRTQVTVSPASARPGASLEVTATFRALADTGQAVVTLESARRTLLNPIAAVPADGDPGRDAVIARNYEAANDKVAAGTSIAVTGGSLSVTLQVPPDLPAGSYHVKVFVRDATRDYGGTAPVTVK